MNKQILQKDGVIGYKSHLKRLWHGVKVLWIHPKITTSKRYLSIKVWAIWDGPKYFWQIYLPPCNKNIDGPTNIIKKKRPFFETAETAIVLMLFVAIVAIAGQ